MATKPSSWATWVLAVLLALAMNSAPLSVSGQEPGQLRQPATAQSLPRSYQQTVNVPSAARQTTAAQQVAPPSAPAQALHWRRRQQTEPARFAPRDSKRKTILPTSGVGEDRGGKAARIQAYNNPFSDTRTTTRSPNSQVRVAQLGERSFDPFAGGQASPSESIPATNNNAQGNQQLPADAPATTLPNALRDPSLQPLTTNPPITAEAVPTDPPASETPSDQSPPPLPFEIQSPAESNPPSLPAPQTSPAPQTLPDPRDNLLREPTDAACKQIYNGRDCCKTANTCRLAHERLESTSIRQVQLDITPKFKPNVGVLRPEKDEQYAASIVARERAFEQLEAREWKNKAGTVLITGRFVDFVNGRIFIETDSGEVVRIPYTELSADDNCFVAGWWQIPGECSLQIDDQPGRNWLASTLTWKASALCHKPLYFEQVQLERYGHSAGPIKQPILSGAHFFVNIATLPYKMGIHPPRECQYALGYYRPGSCAPWLIPPVPLSVRGALAQTAAVAAGIYVLP